jgi:cell division septal protein FtsQ
MKGHTKRRPVKRERKTRRPRSMDAHAAWDMRLNAADDKRTRLQAVSWRTRLAGLRTALFGSPRWISLVVLIGLGAVVYLGGQTPWLVISDVQVEGAVALTADSVVKASGLQGKSIVWADPALAARSVVAMPSVLTATVEIGWPNQARIAVVERAPVMAWDQAGERFWVDEDGVLMPSRYQVHGLLLVLSQEREMLTLGSAIPHDVMQAALQLRQLRPNIDALYYEQANGLSYQDGRNWRAYFGLGNDVNQKLVIYEALVADLMARKMQPDYISVITKEKPFYGLAQSTR